MSEKKYYYYESHGDGAEYNGIGSLCSIIKKLSEEMGITKFEVIEWIKQDSKPYMIKTIKDNLNPYIKYRLGGEQHGIFIYTIGEMI